MLGAAPSPLLEGAGLDSSTTEPKTTITLLAAIAPRSRDLDSTRPSLIPAQPVIVNQRIFNRLRHARSHHFATSLRHHIASFLSSIIYRYRLNKPPQLQGPREMPTNYNSESRMHLDPPTRRPVYPQQLRKPMKVCMVAYAFYETDNRVRRYAEALAKRGDSVEAISLRREGLPAFEVLNGVRVYRVQPRQINEKGKFTHVWRLMHVLPEVDGFPYAQPSQGKIRPHSRPFRSRFRSLRRAVRQTRRRQSHSRYSRHHAGVLRQQVQQHSRFAGI